MAGLFPFFSRASLMLDVVAMAMLGVIPAMCWSIHLARRGRYQAHRRMQMALGAALLLVVAVFEVDVRLNGWRQHAEASPYFDNALMPVLYVHLAVAVSTTLLWIYTILSAMRRFGRDPRPGGYSTRHKLIARLAAMFMIATAVTGWTFYWMAFVAG